MEGVGSGLDSGGLSDPAGVPSTVLQDLLGHHSEEQGAYGL